MDKDETPILRADATDDDLQLEPKFASGGSIGKRELHGDEVPLPDLACPVCGLRECKHNLPYVLRGR